MFVGQSSFFLVFNLDVSKSLLLYHQLAGYTTTLAQARASSVQLICDLRLAVVLRRYGYLAVGGTRCLSLACHLLYLFFYMCVSEIPTSLVCFADFGLGCSHPCPNDNEINRDDMRRNCRRHGSGISCTRTHSSFTWPSGCVLQTSGEWCGLPLLS